jgi:putative endonuclease
MKNNQKSRYFVYMVRCKYGTYYTGYTDDLQKRIEKHNSGQGAKYLRGKSPIELVYAKEYRYLKNALLGERNLKKLKRKQKEALISAYIREKIHPSAGGKELHSPAAT